MILRIVGTGSPLRILTSVVETLARDKRDCVSLVELLTDAETRDEFSITHAFFPAC